MELLDIRQLRAFQELARRESFTEAANHLNLTQSAVSHSIKALEGHLQVSLFKRLGKKVRLTTEGEALLPHADAILDRMGHAIEDVIDRNTPGRGKLRIGATVSICQNVLPSVLRELHDCFPNYEIAVITANDRELIGMLENGQLDIVVAMQTTTSTKVSFDPLFIDEIEMAMAPVHPLTRISNCTVEDIVKEKFIICQRQSETYRIVEQTFVEMKGRIKSPLQVGSMSAIKEMARIGLGVGLLARWVALEEINSGSLVFRPFPREGATRVWGVYTDDRHIMPHVQSVFRGICSSVFENLKVRTKG